ncbi:MAG: hypothetical protein V6Z81_06105 [Parvularculales bacterium]
MLKSSYIILRVTAAEKAKVQITASKFNVNISDFIRNLVIHEHLPDPSKDEAIESLGEANADLTRLVNLLKLGIDEGSFTEVSVSRLMANIEKSQGTMKEIALQLRGVKASNEMDSGK